MRAQWLHRDRPGDLLELVRHVTLLQVDSTAAVAPSADLVAWSRLGAGYDPEDLDRALAGRDLVEFRGTIRPAEDLALYRADMTAWPGVGALLPFQAHQREWVRANESCRTDILRRLSERGPLTSGELPDTCLVPWRSTGWNNDQNIRRMLDFMACRGEIAVAGRRGNQRLWDLAEHVYPDVTPVPLEQAEIRRNDRRLAALGIARSRGPDCPVEPLDVGRAGEEAVVDGVRGTWRVDPSQMGLPFSGRAALLSPLDRLLHDRRRMADLFGFAYAWERFRPAAKRRWGYYAMPILYADELVGKLDATADRAAGVLRVNAVHWDVEPSRTMAAAVDREIRALATWLALEVRSGSSC